MSILRYRPEIDGLRAIAVTVVVLFHAGLQLFNGGFVGVDVFFVISGYLITSIILKESAQEKFSLKLFWLKRIRRIWPALYCVLFVSTLLFAFIYPINLYHNFIQSAFTTQVFASNIYFWSQGGYFGSAHELKPLLHTWSLSIEEQFYIFFPLLLIGLKRWLAQYTLYVIGTMTIISLILCIFYTNYDSNAAFYWIPFRAWELGIGACAAIYGKNISKPNIASITSILGLALIIISVFTFDHLTPFPSYSALLPTTGALLILLSNSPTILVNKILSSSPFTFIGKISYSVYLWHWPIVVLAFWFFPEGHSAHVIISIVLLSYLLGYLSYRFIETPFRNHHKFPNSALLKTYGVATLILIALLTTFHFNSNAILVDPDKQIITQYYKALKPPINRKQCTDVYRKGQDELCQLRSTYKTHSDIDVFVWGDSHADVLMPAFERLVEQSDINIEYSTTLGCQPIINMKRVDVSHVCKDVNARVLSHILDNNYKTVILVGSFVHNIEKGNLRDINAKHNASYEDRLAEFAKNFRATVKQMQDKNIKVIVFTEPPRFSYNPLFETLRSQTLNVSGYFPKLTKEQHYKRISDVYTIIDQSGISRRLDYTNYFCPESECKYQDPNGEFLTSDGSHLSYYGALQLSTYLISDLSKS
ncbi:acyltransferase [Catenovulum sp. 2E275]|uniref:acyltransferase family protein n=1 Tax=Catenovulum sp. 2E275 TaxID=2980497 RepID=UPI0021D222BC|nr:acyltransferase family protein [Catenovulum sp. 2E275]MCU4675454.1 acyltransferase [Catenovulum sp. 2E275]